MKTRKILLLFIVAVALIILACAHAFQDTTNFAGPELKNYRKIVVLPFTSGQNEIDKYYVESLDEYWPGIKIVPMERLLQKFKFKDVQSNRVTQTTLREIRNRFGADAVIKGAISGHYFSPLSPNDRRTHVTLHLIVYVVDLRSFETVACYHSEGWRPTFYEQGSGVPESYYKSLRYIAAGNVKGLVELARSVSDR